jgi:hypothetical protein
MLIKKKNGRYLSMGSHWGVGDFIKFETVRGVDEGEIYDVQDERSGNVQYHVFRKKKLGGALTSTNYNRKITLDEYYEGFEPFEKDFNNFLVRREKVISSARDDWIRNKHVMDGRGRGRSHFKKGKSKVKSKGKKSKTDKSRKKKKRSVRKKV